MLCFSIMSVCRLWIHWTIGVIHKCIQVAIYTGMYLSYILCNVIMFYNVRDISAILLIGHVSFVSGVTIISHCIP